MKRLLQLSLILLLSNSIYAQFYFTFYDLETVSCLNDSSTFIDVPKSLEIYQTLDNTALGIVDSSKCIGIIKIGVTRYIDLSEVDITRPVYIRHKLHDDIESYPLIKDMVYSIYSGLSGPKTYYETDSCEGGYCCQVILGTTIPNSDNSDIIKQWHYLDYTDNSNYLESCIPSQKFEDGQFFHEAIVALKLTQEAKDEGKIRPPYLESNQAYVSNLISEDIEFPEFYFDGTDTYEANLNDLIDGWWGPSLFVHNIEGYPSDENRDYIEFFPEINKTEPQSLIVEGSYDSGELFQNFVALQGGLIEGSEEIRHNLDFRINSNLCLFFIELVMSGGSTVSFHSGSGIDLYGSSACIQLRESAQMTITDNIELRYGEKGKGNLAMKDNSSIKIESGAHFIFDGTLYIEDYDQDIDNDRASIFLEPNASLTFTADSKITTYHSPHMTLDIYMLGGDLDISQLPEVSKSLIRLIYPSTTNQFFNVFPNPTNDFIQPSIRIEQESKYSIYSPDGSLVSQGYIHSSEEGIDIRALSQGTYILSIEVEGKIMKSRFIKLPI